MKQLLMVSILVLGLVCNTLSQKPTEIPKDWKSITGCGVSLYVPTDVTFVEDQSVDTCERFYKGKNSSFHITATEWNVGQSDYSNWPDHCVSKVIINSKNAEIVTSFFPVSSGPGSGRDFLAMLLVPDFFRDGRDLRIHTWSNSEKARIQVLTTLKSVSPDSSK